MENDVLKSIDTLIEIIDGTKPESELPRIPTREEIVNLHYAFLKSLFLLTEEVK